MFVTKYRRKVLINGVDLRLKELIKSVADEIHVDIIEMEIMPDHVHILLEVDPQYGIHKAIKAIKGRTSRVLRQEFPWLRSRLPTLWTNSYFCSTVGGAPLSVIKQYIENQKSICAFGPNNTIIAITSEGKYYHAKIDLKKGGDCEIIQSISLNDADKK